MAQITLPAIMDNLYPALDFIKQHARDLGFDEKKIYWIQLASEEVLANIINYAYKDSKGNMEITCTVKEGKGLKVQVVDWGISFDPLQMSEPDIRAPMENRKIGGLGVYLLRQTMDEVDYKRQDDKNILTFVKY
jgi:anti-sigma regulatory factor (Ser/Thr protein kinase)